MSTEICIFPTSFAQQRLWFLDQLDPGSATYNISRAIYLTGPLHIPTLEASLNEIVQRHESLRTTFGTNDGTPVQVVRDEVPIRLSLIDLSVLPAARRANEEQRLAQAEAHRPFDLNKGPLLRAFVVRLTDEEHVLFLTLHHIISDGWSAGILFRELTALYEARLAGKPSPLPTLPIQYADYAVWQREWLQGDVLEKQLSYWRAQLAEAPDALELPSDRPREAIQTLNGAVESISLSPQLTDALKALSRNEGVTLFMLLLAGFQTLLFRYTGQDDILVGSPFAGRNRIETEGLIGLFINTVVLRTSLSGNPSFRELLQRVKTTSLEAYAHQDLPFERLIEDLHLERNRSYSPLFQVMFASQNAPRTVAQVDSGLSLRPVDIFTNTAKYDLTLLTDQDSDPLTCAFEYNTDLFDADRIVRMLDHFQVLLEGIVADPGQRLGELPLLTETERQQLKKWNDTRVEFPNKDCLHQLFEAQAEKTPNAIALTCGDQRLTYRELNTQSNQLAHHLRRLGVGPEDPVGVCLRRTPEMLIAILGTLKAGGAYLPLDPSYPRERLSFTLEDARAVVLLTQTDLVPMLPQTDSRVVCLDSDWEVIAREDQSNPVSTVTPQNLGCVIYTSGSTGVPKGVSIQHSSTVSFMHWALSSFEKEDLSAVLASTSICFDLSVFEMFAPLCSGGKVMLVENALHLPDLASADVTLVNTVPSAMLELVRLRAIPPSVKVVNLAGEALANSLVQQIYKQDSVREVLNLYGPSEDTTYSTFARLSKGATDEPSIGRPIANTQVYLLDTFFQTVPVGVPGELHLGGAGLARGYLNRPSLTAEKFVPNPFSVEPGERLYRTGDLALYRPDGLIQFLGRKDHQLKLRGFRIELGEIESVLNEHPAVLQAVVSVQEESTGSKRLVAYVVPNRLVEAEGAVSNTRELLVGALRQRLKESLPEFMVPAAFVLLSELPLTPNGKIDRRALPQPEAPAVQTAYVAPRDKYEETIAAILASVLRLERVGVNDNFFDLGGHSLLATQVVARVRDAFQIELPLRKLFDSPTVSGLAEFVGEEKKEGRGTMPAIRALPRQRRPAKVS